METSEKKEKKKGRDNKRDLIRQPKNIPFTKVKKMVHLLTDEEKSQIYTGIENCISDLSTYRDSNAIEDSLEYIRHAAQHIVYLTGKIKRDEERKARVNK